jgi:ABC-2 type transport system ATP-binding protein
MTYYLRGASVRFGDTLALDDVTVDIEPGSVVAAVGGDGAGKTTLLRALVGEVPLDSGTAGVPPQQDIGYLPASSGSWSALTVAQNMDFVGGIYGLSGAALTSRRTELLGRAGLEEYGTWLASKLSGGMRRKLAFSMTMLHRPRLLVLDEPSTGVDPVSRIDLWRLVSEAAADGAAVVMSTTYLDEAERAAQLVALDAGRELARGTVTDVLASFRGAITRTPSPRRREMAWRRGRQYHEYWPVGADVPREDERVAPDLEDVVIALAIEARTPATVTP